MPVLRTTRWALGHRHGTAAALMHDTLNLRPDGTGYLQSHAIMRGEATTPLLWRHDGPGRLRMALVEPDDGQGEWELVEYTATVVVDDAGRTVEALTNDADASAFWTLAGPIIPR